jgi:hypothetical protein
MSEAATLRAAWESFYVIVGSSAAALIGIQFVVIALIANFRRAVSAEPIHAFATPTVVHLGAALVVSTLMSAPWPSLFPLSLAVEMCGVAGLGYGAIVIGRARRQTQYAPVFEDWLWHAALPLGLYAGLALAALLLRGDATIPLFVVAGATLGLLLVGIHNAWDSVTHLVVSGSRDTLAPPE